MKQCQGENDSVSSSPLCANHCHRQDGNLKAIKNVKEAKMNKHTKGMNSGPRNWGGSLREGFGGGMSQIRMQKRKGRHNSRRKKP